MLFNLHIECAAVNNLIKGRKFSQVIVVQSPSFIKLFLMPRRNQWGGNEHHKFTHEPLDISKQAMFYFERWGKRKLINYTWSCMLYVQQISSTPSQQPRCDTRSIFKQFQIQVFWFWRLFNAKSIFLKEQ